LAIDNIVMLAKAPHSEEAYALMNYLLDVQAHADFVARTLSGPVVLGVKERLPAKIQGNTTLFPSDESLKNCEMMLDLGEATAAYDRIWSELKVQSH
jgi:spermidine/putrescine transport system substrate-binding protein